MKTLRNLLLAVTLFSIPNVVHSQCDSNFTASFTALDQGGNIAVFNSSPNLPVNGFYWDFGDGDSGYGSFTQHYYQQPGTYYVCLDAWYWDQNTQDSCWTSTCQWVTLSGPNSNCDSLVSADFSWQTNQGTVLFTDASYSAGSQTWYYWQFGDGATSTDQNPIHDYFQNGQYYVCLDVYTVDQNGYQCSDSLCTWITISGLSDPCDSSLNTYFTPLQVQGNIWTFNNATWSIDPNATYFWWDFGDGTNSSLDSPTHTFPGPGTYIVCLIAQVWNCVDTLCVPLTIPPDLDCDSTFVAQFNWSSTGGNVAVFSDASNTSGQQAFYNWSFGDGTYDYIPSPVHTYSVPGQYYVCLDLWYWNQNTQDTCWSSYCEWIVVQGGNLDCDSVPHFADFTYFANANWVNFYDQSILSGNNATYYWDFGDGNSSTNQNPFHQYGQSGTYIVCLYTAIGINNGMDSCFSSICDTVWVNSSSGCDSTFSADFGSTSSENTVYFVDLSNTAGQLATYNWSFGDGTYGYTSDPIHTFPGPGQYYVCLDLRYWNQNLQDSCWSISCQWVDVLGGNLDCDSVTHYSGFIYNSIGNDVYFYDQSYTSGYTATYEWYFGDGGSSTDQNPFHQYSQPGTYEVCLYTAIGINNGADSCFSSYCDTISVNTSGSSCDSTFVATFSVYDQGGNIGVFTASTSIPASGYIWDFGDGTTGYGNPTQNFYQQTGAYYVCLEAWYWNQNTQDSCWTSTCQWVTIGNLGNGCDSTFVADFSFSMSGNTAYFTDLSYTNGFITSYYWDFGDGSFDWGSDPIHTYQQTGAYYVCLNIWYWDNNILDTCMATHCEMIIVSQTGIAENLFGSTPIGLYPNPGNGMISLGNENHLSDLSLTITDLRGRVIQQFAVGTLSAASPDLRHLVGGVYLFIFKLNEAQRTERYILE